MAEGRPVRSEVNVVGWITEVAPRLGLASFSIAAVVINGGAKMAVDTSAGRLPTLTPACHRAILQASIRKQMGFHLVWCASIRELKFVFESFKMPPLLSTMCAAGCIGVPLASLHWNHAIQDTYVYFKMPLPRVGGLMDYYRLKIAPGIMWSFVRGAGATGAGLHLGPSASAFVGNQLKLNDALPKDVINLTGGLTSGILCAVATQWAHNVALIAGRMAALGEKTQAPYYTRLAVHQAWKEMGLSMLYSGLATRVPVTAATVAALHVCNLFHRPDFSGWEQSLQHGTAASGPQSKSEVRMTIQVQSLDHANETARQAFRA